MAIEPVQTSRTTVREAIAEVECGIAPAQTTAVATQQTTALAKAAPVDERHRVEIAVGSSLMAVGAQWGRHPIVVTVGTAAAYAGVAASGALTQALGTPLGGAGFLVALFGLGAAFINVATGNGIAQPLFFKGVGIATQACKENLERGVDTGDAPLARKSMVRMQGIMTKAADVLRRTDPRQAAELTKGANAIARDVAKVDKLFS